MDFLFYLGYDPHGMINLLCNFILFNLYTPLCIPPFKKVCHLSTLTMIDSIPYYFIAFPLMKEFLLPSFEEVLLRHVVRALEVDC